MIGMFEIFGLTKVLHIAAVASWAGAIWFVSGALLPAIAKRFGSAEGHAVFAEMAPRFARRARFSMLLIGLTGLGMVWAGGLWSRFSDSHFWWMHVMVCTWLLFALMLFVLEPFGRFHAPSHPVDPEQEFGKTLMIHRILAAIATITLAVAVGGSLGLI